MILTLALLAAPSLVAPTLAETSPADTTPSPSTPSPSTPSPSGMAEGAAARLIEAHRLASLGQTAQDPVLLFAAARLMQGLQLTETWLRPADPTDSAPTPAEGSADWTPDASTRVPDPAKAAPLPGALDPAALFEAARQMAPEESALREAIALAAAEVPPPPALLHVAAQSQTAPQSFALPIPGGDPVQIGLLRLTGALAYRLATPDGAVLCEDASTSAASLCTVTLPESQTLTLTTTPLGTGAADWLFLTP